MCWLRISPEREHRTRRSLKQENDSLREELAAFTPEFWEELEDLKHAHAHASEMCRKYERQLGISNLVAGCNGTRSIQYTT